MKLLSKSKNVYARSSLCSLHWIFYGHHQAAETQPKKCHTCLLPSSHIEIPKVVSKCFRLVPAAYANNANLLLAAIEMKCFFCLYRLCRAPCSVHVSFSLIPLKLLSASNGRQWLNNSAQRRTQTGSVSGHILLSLFSPIPKKTPTDAFSLLNRIREVHLFVIWDSGTLFWWNIYFWDEKLRDKKTNPKLSQMQCSSTLLSAGLQV